MNMRKGLDSGQSKKKNFAYQNPGHITNVNRPRTKDKQMKLELFKCKVDKQCGESTLRTRVGEYSFFQRCVDVAIRKNIFVIFLTVVEAHRASPNAWRPLLISGENRGANLIEYVMHIIMPSLGIIHPYRARLIQQLCINYSLPFQTHRFSFVRNIKY